MAKISKSVYKNACIYGWFYSSMNQSHAALMKVIPGHYFHIMLTGITVPTKIELNTTSQFKPLFCEQNCNSSSFQSNESRRFWTKGCLSFRLYRLYQTLVVILHGMRNIQYPAKNRKDRGGVIWTSRFLTTEE